MKELTINQQIELTLRAGITAKAALELISIKDIQLVRLVFVALIEHIKALDESLSIMEGKVPSP